MLRAFPLCLVFLAFGCSSALRETVVSEAEFRATPSFQGQVVAIERLEWPADFRPTSISAGHYRARIIKRDSTVLVVDRIETALGAEKRLTDQLWRACGTCPNDIYEAHDERSALALCPGVERPP
jgi:hypothetical protein